MALPPKLAGRLSLPLIASPMFIVSNPRLVIAQCQSGIIGSFPALNARSGEQLEEWLCEIREALTAWDAAHPGSPAAPFAVNHVVQASNPRLEEDLQRTLDHRVSLIITSLGAREDIYRAIHAHGGIVLHDVINDRFARKAIAKGADGVIAVCAGAGGHAGTLSPFALIQEIRAWFDGPLALSGAIASGGAILAAQVMGADLAYAGSPFIATHEANAPPAYKLAIVDAGADDIVYTDLFSGMGANFLRGSIAAAGLDPDRLQATSFSSRDFGTGGASEAKAWRDIWSSGQGVGTVRDIQPAAGLIAKWKREYAVAYERICGRRPVSAGGMVV